MLTFDEIRGETKNKIAFNVETTVQGKARPRVTVNKAGFVQAYTLAKTREAEQAVKAAFLDSVTPETLQELKNYTGEVLVTIQTHRALPKSKSKPEPDTFKPDADNIAKLVLDALNGYAYKDDKQVTGLVILKSPRKTRDQDFMRVELFYR